MLKIKIENNKIQIENSRKVKISFALSQKHIFEIIKKNIEAINKDGCSFSIEKIGKNGAHLILDKNYKLLLPELSAYEIQSRMQLVAERLEMPSDNVQDSD